MNRIVAGPGCTLDPDSLARNQNLQAQLRELSSCNPGPDVSEDDTQVVPDQRDVVRTPMLACPGCCGRNTASQEFELVTTLQ